MPRVGDTITPEHLSAETAKSRRQLQKLAEKYAPRYKDRDRSADKRKREHRESEWSK